MICIFINLSPPATRTTAVVQPQKNVENRFGEHLGKHCSYKKVGWFFEIQIGNISWGENSLNLGGTWGVGNLDEACCGEFHPNRWNDVWPVSSVHWACLPLGDWWMMESHWGFEHDFFEQRLSDVVWDEISDLSFF